MLWSPRHRRLRRLLDAHVDGMLEDPADTELAEHLLECEGCRHDAVVTRQVKEALARLGRSSRHAAPRPTTTTER